MTSNNCLNFRKNFAIIIIENESEGRKMYWDSFDCQEQCEELFEEMYEEDLIEENATVAE